jgi:hypothetical protein
VIPPDRVKLFFEEAKMGEDTTWLITPVGQRADGSWITDILAERAKESGLFWRYAEANNFSRERMEVVRGLTDDDLQRLYYRRGWTDGLPVVLPTRARVRSFLRHARQNGDKLIGEAEPLFGQVTIEKAAANAVMAGCDPVHFPFVISALEAVLDPSFNLRGVQTTDENVTPLLLISGPELERLDLHGGVGAIGPGWRGNMVIGRALRLSIQNLGGGWPGTTNLAGLGQPGRLWLVLPENEVNSPWQSLRERLGYSANETVLMVLRAEATVTCTGRLDDLASLMRSSLSAFSRLHGGICAVAIAPFVAQGLAEEGWTEQDVRQYLWDLSQADPDDYKRSWVVSDLQPRSGITEWASAAIASGKGPPAVETPDHIVLVVAGANAAIPQHAYFPTWGFPEAKIIKMVQRID